MDIVHVSETVNGLQSAFFLMDSRGQLLCLGEKKKTQSIPKFLWDPSKHFPDVFRDSVCVCTEQTIEAILSMKVNLGVRKEKHLSLRLHNRKLQTNI